MPLSNGDAVVTGLRAPWDVAALTRRMAQGDEMAWRAFYDAYFDRLWRYLLVVAHGNEDQAREALQAALLRVTRHIKGFSGEEVFWSWLTVLARCSFADETKKSRRYFSLLARFTLHAEMERAGDAGRDVDEQLQASLDRAIATLPLEEQELVAQMYFAHRSMRDIADELCLTEKAVESKLSRIRRKLKDAALKELKNET